MPAAKLTKPQRGKRALMGGLTAEELFDDLSAAYRKATGKAKISLGLELVPYLKPKLKAVDVTQRTDVRVTAHG